LRRRTRTEKRWVMSPRNRKAFMAAAPAVAAPAAQRLGRGFRTTAPDAQGNGGGDQRRGGLRTPGQEETRRVVAPSWAGVDRVCTAGTTWQ